MKISSNINYLNCNFTSLSQNIDLLKKTPLTKKIVVVATIIFCILAISYWAIYYFWPSHKLQPVEENLAKGDYISAMKILRNQSLSLRLSCLRSHAPEIDPILMYEQAIAEFENKPTIETYNLIAMPLLKAARFRVRQDVACSNDLSLGDADLVMEMNYGGVLYEMACNSLNENENFQKLLDDSDEIRKKAVRQKICEVAKQSLTTVLPSPTWVFHHGLCVGKSKPEIEWKSSRDKVANDALIMFKA